LHEIRSDYAQIMSVLFLGIVGPGPWSLDAIFARRRRQNAVPEARRENRISRSGDLRLAQ